MEYLMDNKMVTLMIWETNVNKRQKALTQTNFRVHAELNLNVGDSVYIQIGDTKSVYIIEEIQNQHQSSMKGFNYIKTFCSWRAEKPSID